MGYGALISYDRGEYNIKNNLTISREMIKFQNSMDSYLKSINIGYSSTTSIFTVENKTLTGYSSGTYKLENG